jgi:nucleoside phosphorylase
MRISEFFTNQQRRVREEIASLHSHPSELSLDRDFQRLFVRFSLEPIVLLLEDIYATSPRSSSTLAPDGYRRPDGSPRMVKQKHIGFEIRIPIQDNPDVEKILRMVPSTSSSAGDPQYEYDAISREFALPLSVTDPTKAAALKDQAVRIFEVFIGWKNTEIRAGNRNLEAMIKKELKKRGETLERAVADAASISSSLGIPIKEISADTSRRDVAGVTARYVNKRTGKTKVNRGAETQPLRLNLSGEGEIAYDKLPSEWRLNKVESGQFMLELPSGTRLGKSVNERIRGFFPAVNEVLFGRECLWERLPLTEQYDWPDFEDVSAAELLAKLECIELLLMTTTDIEARTVLSFLEPYRGDRIWRGTKDGVTFYGGQFGKYPVAMVRSRMGSGGRHGSQQTLTSAITTAQPKGVIIIGIAFGMDRENQRLGDVLVSEAIQPYELSKITSDKDGLEVTEDRAIPFLSSRILSGLFRDRVQDWKVQRTVTKVMCSEPGLMLSGEKLVNKLEFRNNLRRRFSRAIGGEMEWHGAYAACDGRCEVILVKAICDWADGDKDDEAQPFAAFCATSLCHHVLKQADVLGDIGVLDVERVPETDSMSCGTSMDDASKVEQMSRCFARPAFTTPLQAEVSFPNFEKAVTDTIEALNTGVWRLRDGTEITRIASRFDINDSNLREDLERLVEKLVELRRVYLALSKTGSVRDGSCGTESCSIVFLDEAALNRLSGLRAEILQDFGQIQDRVTSGRAGGAYDQDAKALALQMENAVKELEAGIYGTEREGGIDRESIANTFVDETMLGDSGIAAKLGKFCRYWEAKDEGSLVSYSSLLAAGELLGSARRRVSRAVLQEPDLLEIVFTDCYLECQKAVRTAIAFLAEGK